MARLVAEVRGAFSRSEDMNFENLARLPYLNACLKETMRVFPSVPIGSPRIIPPGGKRILNRWVPPDTHVSVSGIWFSLCCPAFLIRLLFSVFLFSLPKLQSLLREYMLEGHY